MNPLSKEYQGRSILPDSLKVLFRSVSMKKPNSVKIIEVLLLTQGFSSEFSKIISVSLEKFMKAAKNVFWKNKIYDWGLRCVKKIILYAG